MRCSTTPTSRKHPFLVKGYLGPKALLDNGVRYLIDPRVVDGTSWITGADAPGQHVVELVAGRHSPPTAPSRPPRCATVIPRRMARVLWWSARGIEVAHIFQLGRKYTDAFTVELSARTASRCG